MQIGLSGWEYDTIQYRDVMSKKEQCKVEISFEGGKNPKYEKWRKNINETEKEYREYCPKSKSNNIISCPKSIVKKAKDVNVKWINDWFKNFRKKKKKSTKKKKTKKKKKKKKSKYSKQFRFSKVKI